MRLLAEASDARQRQDAAAELRLIDAALSIDPAHPHAANARGMIALRSRHFADAARFFERAAQADPGQPALWMNVATAKRALSDDAGELAGLERALQADQLHFMALVRKAELHQRRDELALATRSWQAVLALSAGMADIPPALMETLEEARIFVDRQVGLFCDVVDTGLAAARAALPLAERRRVDACIDQALGRRKIYHNECAGAHFPFLPADEFFDRRHFPWLAALEAQTAVITRELQTLIEGGGVGTRPYVTEPPGTPPNKWSPLAGSLDWEARFLWEFGQRNDAVCAQCPETARILESLPQADIPRRAPTAFFSLLKPRTHIPPHTGVTNTRTILHLPLIVPPGCGFRVGGETREWKVGEALAFDDTIEHEAWNRSDQLRAILIFDVWNPYMSAAECQLMREFFDVADKSGHYPDAAFAN